MSAIRKRVQEYLALRRGLGFKLHQEGVWLDQFASFLKQRRSSCITTKRLSSGPRCRGTFIPRT